MRKEDKAAIEIIKKEQKTLLHFAKAVSKQLSPITRGKLRKQLDMNDEYDLNMAMKLPYLANQLPVFFRLASAICDIMLSFSTFLSEKRKENLVGKLNLSGFATYLKDKQIKFIPRYYFVNEIKKASNTDTKTADEIWAGFVRAVCESKTSLPSGLILTNVRATIELDTP